VTAVAGGYDAGMEPDRFDDVVVFQIEDTSQPRPRRPRRRRRWTLAGLASLVVAGGLAAGASALTGGGSARPAAAKPARAADGVVVVRSHRGCHHPMFHYRGSSTAYAPAPRD
jgi:hypothetical protein